MRSRGTLLKCAAGILLASICGCKSLSGINELSEDKTRLEGQPRELIARQLELAIAAPGDISEQVRSELAEAFVAELEDGNLFGEVRRVPAESPRAPNTARLELTLKRRLETSFGGIFASIDGWLVRYDLNARLIDSAGEVVTAGPVTGVAYDDDDDTEVDDFDYAKKRDIDLAAQRDAAVKLSDVLESEVERRIEAALAEVPVLRLAPGVGPLPMAIVHIDVRRAHPRSRASRVEADLRSALALAGSEVAIIDAARLDRLLEIENLPEISGLSLPPEVAAFLERELPARFVILIEVRARARDVEMEGTIVEVAAADDELGASSKPIGQARVQAQGVGAVRVAAVNLARALVEALAEVPFEDPAGPAPGPEPGDAPGEGPPR